MTPPCEIVSAVKEPIYFARCLLGRSHAAAVTEIVSAVRMRDDLEAVRHESG